MAQIKTGTVTVTPDSALVTGSGVEWVGYVAAGHWFKIQGEPVTYTIATDAVEVDGVQQFTLTGPYSSGTGGSGLEYAIQTHFTEQGIPLLDLADADPGPILSRGMQKIDQLIQAGGGGGGGHTIQEEGIAVSQRSKLNFVGGGAELSDDSGNGATVIRINKNPDLSVMHTANARNAAVKYNAPFFSIQSLNLPRSIDLPKDADFKMGANDNAISVYGYAVGEGSNYGFEWSDSLDRIDFSLRTMAALGLKRVKCYGMPVNLYTLQKSLNGSRALTGSELGWENLDFAIATCRKLGMKLQWGIQAPYTNNNVEDPTDGWGYYTSSSLTANGGKVYDVTKFLDYWVLPIATYGADRYKNDHDVLEIQPVGEIQWLFGLADPAVGMADAVTFHCTVYDAIKAVAPDIPVILSGCPHMKGLNQAKTVEGFLDAMSAAGKIAKFDSMIDIHLYPHQADLIVSGRSALDATYALGEGSNKDVASAITKLNTLGRTDAKVIVGEFGVFWAADVGVPGGDTGTPELSGQDIIDTYNYFRDNPRVDGICYWKFWGIYGASAKYPVSAPGMGICQDRSDLYQRTRPSDFTENSLVKRTSTNPAAYTRIVVDDDDNLGVKTATPRAPLHINLDSQAGVTPAVGTALYNASSCVVESTQDNSVQTDLVVADDTTTPGFRGCVRGVRARGTLASPAIPQTGDMVLSLVGGVWTGARVSNSADITMKVDGVISEGGDGTQETVTAPVRIVFQTRPYGWTWYERMVILPWGNIGIDTSEPTERLEVNGNVKATAFIGDVPFAWRDTVEITADTTLTSADAGKIIRQGSVASSKTATMPLLSAMSDGQQIMFHNSDDSDLIVNVGDINDWMLMDRSSVKIFRVAQFESVVVTCLKSAGFVPVWIATRMGGRLETASDSANQNNIATYNDSTTVSSFVTGRKAKGSVSSPAAVDSADHICLGLVGSAWSGSNWRNVAGIRFYNRTAVTETNSEGYIVFYTTPSGSIYVVERLSIRPDGRLRVINQPARPASNKATGTTGDIIFVDGYLYYCFNGGTDDGSTVRWGRVALNTGSW